jgi:hypothetical protein
VLQKDEGDREDCSFRNPASGYLNVQLAAGQSHLWSRSDKEASGRNKLNESISCDVRFGINMTTWREDALKGAIIGALIFPGVAPLLGVAFWLR